LLVDDTVILQVCIWSLDYMTQEIYTKECLRLRLCCGCGKWLLAQKSTFYSL